MYDYKKLVLGYAPTRRFDFPDPKNAYENSLKIRARVDEALAAIGDVELVDLAFLNEEALLYQACDVEAVARHFEARRVEALFIPHANFGCEEAAVKLAARLRLPVLVWGPRDEAPPAGYGYRQTDTQCGLFATTMGFYRERVSFSYIENCRLDSPLLAEGLDRFVRVACGAKAFRQMKIGQIGPRPRDFLSVMVDEGSLTTRFGIQVVPIDGTELVAEIDRFRKEEAAQIDTLTRETKAAISCGGLSPENAGVMAATELAIGALAERYGCTLMAGDCWYINPLIYGSYPCFAFGNLTEKGLPVICETDIHGAVTAGLLSGVARYQSPTFTADMTIRHPENDNAELLWHCGPFPKALANAESRPEVTDECMGRYEIVGGDVSLARFGGVEGDYRLFFGQGRGVPGPETGGNYLWLEVADWPKWERKLMYGPYIHHICGVHGRYTDALRDLCGFLDIAADAADD